MLVKNVAVPLLFFCLLVISKETSAQVFGGDPSGIKWNNINTAESRIIFAKGLDSVAGRISNTIQTIGPQYALPRTKKLNIVLRHQTVNSNGYVTLGPYRSEFFLTPPQNSFSNGSLPWADQLAIHEYRHAVQYSQMNTGLSAVARTLFGQQAQALANAASVPNWFFEGDAIYAETNFSRQGRGSLPAFYNDYRSLWQQELNYSWMKLRNGSLKDQVPDHYALGYLLVAYGYEKYGIDFWKNVINDAASYKGFFYPFQKAIKKYSGVSFKHFRKEGLSFFKQQFATDSVFNVENAEPQFDELFPAFTEDGKLVTVKRSYKKTSRFLLTDSTGSSSLGVVGQTLEPYFSYANQQIIFAGNSTDIRRGNRQYNDIVILDIHSGRRRWLSHHKRYFSPSFNEAGDKLVAVQVAGDGQSEMHVLDRSSGVVTDVIPNPDKFFHTYPRFLNDSIIVSSVRNSAGKMSVVLTRIRDGHSQMLLPFTDNVAGAVCVSGDTLCFPYSYKNNDELFAFTLSDKKLWKLNFAVQKGFGKYHPAIHGDKLAWQTFTARGYRIQSAQVKDLQFEPVLTEKMQKVTSSFGITSLNKRYANLLYTVPEKNPEVVHYAKSSGLFNFHSLQPFIDDPVYRLSLLSENVLNTFISDLSVSYDRAERSKKAGFHARYGGWFPVVSAGVDYTIDRPLRRGTNVLYFNELEPYLGFNIPLNFSKGRSLAWLNAGSQYVYNHTFVQKKYKDSADDISYGYLNNFISFTHQELQGRQQIFPRFAQTIRLAYKTAVQRFSGNQSSATANVYFPGIAANHSIVINGAFLRHDSLREINFSSGFPFSRGYEAYNYYRMAKWGVNYHFPLCYPDVGFANIIYLLRLRGNVFYDDTQVKDFNRAGEKMRQKFRSAGLEIYADTKWWNQAAISVGLRYSRLIDKDMFGNSNASRWEIILPVNIFNQ